MATLTVTAHAERSRKRVNDEPFGGATTMAVLSIVFTLVGFWRSFFSILGDQSAVHMWHGATSAGWLVLVLVQSSLIRSRHFRLHRILGWGSVVLFAALLASSWIVLAIMLSGRSGVPYEFSKLFALSDVTAVPLMIVAYVGAIVCRRDRHVHSRLVSVTLVAGLLPAISRMFNMIWTGPDGLIFAMHPTYQLALAMLGAAIVADWRAKRLRWPFPFGFAWMALSYAMLFPAWKSDWFEAIAQAIAASA